MNKVAFYIMNSKGWFVFSQFIERFGGEKVAYVVGELDENLKNDHFNDIKKLSENKKIPFYKRTVFNTQIEDKFEGYKFAVGWRWMIKNQQNLIVFHDSLLPKYRGFSPLVNSLINNELQGGVTALFAGINYDEGEMIGQRNVVFEYPLKIEAAIKLIEPLYFDLLCDIYKIIQSGKSLQATEQDHSKATYSLWLDQEDYFINWEWSAGKIKRFVDAVSFPYDGSKARLNEKIVRFEEVEVEQDVHVEHRERHIGKVIFFDDFPVIVCTKGLLKLLKITDEAGLPLNINFRSRFK